uniref:Uncharacterized protein n=1 Tax=Arundo donax TaxID=35708 RepID=A0A0A9FF30_ARUDO
MCCVHSLPSDSCYVTYWLPYVLSKLVKLLANGRNDGIVAVGNRSTLCSGLLYVANSIRGVLY